MTLEEALSHSYSNSDGITVTFISSTSSTEGTASISIAGEGTYVYDETTKSFTITVDEYSYVFTIKGNTLIHSEAGVLTIVE